MHLHDGRKAALSRVCSCEEWARMQGTRSNTSGYFEVSHLVGRRVAHDGELEYRVRWMGHSAASDTWEPRRLVKATCEDMLNAMDKKLSPKPATPSTQPTDFKDAASIVRVPNWSKRRKVQAIESKRALAASAAEDVVAVVRNNKMRLEVVTADNARFALKEYRLRYPDALIGFLLSNAILVSSTHVTE
jgi:hypothetical protein